MRRRPESHPIGRAEQRRMRRVRATFRSRKLCRVRLRGGLAAENRTIWGAATPQISAENVQHV
jgi:hypothetical protein